MNKLLLNKKSLILYALLILMALTIPTYGRYVYSSIRDFYLASKSFYFNSDKLTINNRFYQVDNWSAAEAYTIPITLNNSKNNLLHSESDISYTIEYKCSKNIDCSVSSMGGILYSSESQDQFKIVLSPKANINFKSGDTASIEVKATSTTPYKKTLMGTFILKVGDSDLFYSIKDVKGRPYFDLQITNTLDYYTVKEPFLGYNINDRIDRLTYLSLNEENKLKCNSVMITLNFDPNKVIMDMTNTAYLNASNINTTNINGFNYVNSIMFRMDSETSMDIRFYKANSNFDYTYPFTNSNSIVKVDYLT